ncbi:hypothetical protein FIC87_12650 [Eggerthella lenta]|uniref:DUF4355 domain-containing protein n=1 Tax=Eggerthella lenta TaxID=84112 RepID=A0A5C5BRI7_EGGLN|nr:hypothetical protein [Eggerthella lenta]TNU89043.1 hypothetical protein FIC87_12650 [Eggerthella lenta]
MADEATTEAIEPTQAGPQTEPHGEGAQKPATDWKAEARKWEARAKENKGAAETHATEAEKAKEAADRAKAEAEAAKAEADRLKAEKAREEAVKEAARTAGVDAELLALMAGDAPEQIAANAGLLKAKIAALPIYPAVSDSGAGASPAISKDQIMGIKDPVERIKQIAAHAELFKN